MIIWQKCYSRAAIFGTIQMFFVNQSSTSFKFLSSQAMLAFVFSNACEKARCADPRGQRQEIVFQKSSHCCPYKTNSALGQRTRRIE